MSTLNLHLKRKYWEQVKRGKKKEEYRKVNKFWSKILSKDYEQIKLYLGYPKKGETEKVIVLPYRGYEKKTIKHEIFKKPSLFEKDETLVFAIKLTPETSK